MRPLTFTVLLLGFVSLLIGGCNCKLSSPPGSDESSLPSKVGVPANGNGSANGGKASGTFSFQPVPPDQSASEAAIAARAAISNLSRLSNAQKSDYERRLNQGVSLLQSQDYGKAILLFTEILKDYPGTEEASVAEFCIAQIHFRNKNNNMALETFKKILEAYPNTPAAERAQEGIDYLTNFEKYEKEYVSPEVDDRKRRGR